MATNNIKLLNNNTKRQPQQEHYVLDHPKGPDWVHASIVVKETTSMGLGLVATDFIAKGSTVILFGGHLFNWKEFYSLPEELINFPYQIADDVFFGVRNIEDIGIGERINHSCNPNTGFTSEMRLIAIRDILPGEDVTMDYASCSSTEDYSLICKCGSKNCRGIVTGTDWQLPSVQHKLKDYLQPYLKEKILLQRNNNFFSTLSSVFSNLSNMFARLS